MIHWIQSLHLRPLNLYHDALSFVGRMKMLKCQSIRCLVLVAIVSLFACGDEGGAVSVTEPMADFDVYDCENNPVNVKNWAAQYDIAFITWGAQWCTACAKEVPIINTEIVEHFSGSNVGVAQILVENQIGEMPLIDNCTHWVDDNNPDFPILVDLDWTAVDAVFDGAVGSTLPLQTLVKDDEVVMRSYTATIEDVQTLIGAFLQ